MTLENTIVTAATVLGVLAVGWLIMRIARKRLPQNLSDVIGQLAPAVAVSLVVVGVLIILDPDQAKILQDGVRRYVPSALTAILVIILARAAGRIVGVFVEAALRAVSPVMASRARLIVSSLILGVGVIIALDQLGISTDIILLLVAAIAFGTALAGGLAVGLGSLPVARQVAAGRHVSDRYRVGQRLAVAGYVGRLTAIGLLTSRLVTDEGIIVEVPNESFLSASVSVLEEPAE